MRRGERGIRRNDRPPSPAKDRPLAPMVAASLYPSTVSVAAISAAVSSRRASVAHQVLTHAKRPRRKLPYSSLFRGGLIALRGPMPVCKVAKHAAGALGCACAHTCSHHERAASHFLLTGAGCAAAREAVLASPGHGPRQSSSRAPDIRFAALAHAPRRQPIGRLDLQHTSHPMSARPSLHMNEAWGLVSSRMGAGERARASFCQASRATTGEPKHRFVRARHGSSKRRKRAGGRRKTVRSQGTTTNESAPKLC